jgi:hypothetical protein
MATLSRRQVLTPGGAAVGAAALGVSLAGERGGSRPRGGIAERKAGGRGDEVTGPALRRCEAGRCQAGHLRRR